MLEVGQQLPEQRDESRGHRAGADEKGPNKEEEEWGQVQAGGEGLEKQKDF